MKETTRLSDRERFDWLRLSRSENVGPRTFAMLLKRHGSARAALEALPGLNARNPGKRALHPAEEKDIEQEFIAAERLGAQLIADCEPDYPWLLRQIDSAPPIIAVRGDRSVFAKPTVAIIGSRNASASGLAFAEQLARGLAETGYVIVSGLARGIDARAHRATLETGTVAVLAGGHDKIYPTEHTKLLEDLIEKGAAVSEMPFGWSARDRDFPRRNRIVSGLSLGTIVVEAAKNSGSLITARFALEQGREVFAVPGSPLDPRAKGTNGLLRDGVPICTCVEDVIDSLARLQNGLKNLDLFSESDESGASGEPYWDEYDFDDVSPQKPPRAPSKKVLETSWAADLFTPASQEQTLLPEEIPAGPERVLDLLGPSPVSIDELVRASDLPAKEVRAILLELEIAGRLERHGGNLVSLLKP